jgi:hypothetical protein
MGGSRKEEERGRRKKEEGGREKEGGRRRRREKEGTVCREKTWWQGKRRRKMQGGKNAHRLQVDYKGFRLSCQSVIRGIKNPSHDVDGIDENSSLIFGSCDAGMFEGDLG